MTDAQDDEGADLGFEVLGFGASGFRCFGGIGYYDILGVRQSGLLNIRALTITNAVVGS